MGRHRPVPVVRTTRTPASRIGEAWFTADANPTSVGPTFGELTRTFPAEILGPDQGDECPLLVKILFTSERLSVQVHPDDEYARAAPRRVTRQDRGVARHRGRAARDHRPRPLGAR